MAWRTKQINVDREAWSKLRTIVINLSINTKLIDPEDISDSKVSIYLNRILNEFLKQRNLEDPKVGFTREY